MGDGARLTSSAAASEAAAAESTDAPFSAAASRALAALLPSRRKREAVLLGPGVSGSERYAGPGKACKEREIIKSLQGKNPVAVLVLRTVTTNLLRALRAAPPDLLVLLDEAPAKDKTRHDTLGTLVLGPGATLRVDESALRRSGHVIGCAHALDEFEGLLRALRDHAVGLGLAPTPRWLWRWLQSDALTQTPAVGYVGADVLDIAWARFANRREAPAVLVPVGLQAGALPDSDDELAASVAAAALERRTGPVFPAPRVLRLVLDRLCGVADDALAPTPQQRAVWAQALRALPSNQGLDGMDAPADSLPMEAPTAAFLAQRALLRAEALEALVAGPKPVVDFIDDDGVARSSEILRGAAEVLTDQESKVVLRGFGFEVTRQAVANSASGAAGFADRIGYPVVLKALSPDLRRRSDVGGVVLALSTAAAVRRAYAQIIDSLEKEAPTARIDGVLVAEMIGAGLDIRCGGRKLASGDTVLYGQITSGSHPAAPSVALHPLSPEDALAFAHAIISRASTLSLRRRSDPDVSGLASLLLRLSTVFSEAGDRMLTVDLGPARLASTERGYVTLDARITQQAHLEGL